MRLLVLALAVLAAFKIWASHHLYRQAAEDVIVAAYRERAIAACQRDAASTGDAKSAPIVVANWTRPASIRVVIGKQDVDVNVWDTDNAKWQTRYKQAFLMLQPAGGTTGPACEYDISANHATLVRG